MWQLLTVKRDLICHTNMDDENHASDWKENIDKCGIKMLENWLKLFKFIFMNKF